MQVNVCICLLLYYMVFFQPNTFLEHRIGAHVASTDFSKAYE